MIENLKKIKNIIIQSIKTTTNRKSTQGKEINLQGQL